MSPDALPGEPAWGEVIPGEPTSGEQVLDKQSPGEQMPWRRLHPITPLVRGWKAAAVVLVFLGQRLQDDLVSGDLPVLREALGGLIIVVAILLLAMVWAFFSWRCARFRISPQVVELKTGVLFRAERQARLDRVQAVDIIRPLVGRLLGLAELRLEVAGGSNSDVTLSLLSESAAIALRAELLARSAGVDAQAAPAVERPVLAVPLGRMVESLARQNFVLISGGIAILAGISAVMMQSAQPLLIMVPMFLGVLTVTWSGFSTEFGFRVAIAADGVRIRHGLLTTRSQTVPPGRIQALSCRQPRLWRAKGWWEIKVNVAGYSAKPSAGQSLSDSGSTDVLLTVGTWSQVTQVLSLVFPHAVAEEGLAAVLERMAHETKGAMPLGYVSAPRAARWVDPLGWRRRGVYACDSLLVLRHGFFTRQVDLVPHARSQSLTVYQGPWQRKLGLASFAVHSTPGPVRPRADHLAARDAAELLHAQAERAGRFTRLATDRDQGPWVG